MSDWHIGDRAMLQGHPVIVRAMYGTDVLVEDDDGVGYVSHTTASCLLPRDPPPKKVVRLSPVYTSDDIDTPEKLWRWASSSLPDPKRFPDFATKAEAMWEELNVLKFIAACIDERISKERPDGGWAA